MRRRSRRSKRNIERLAGRINSTSLLSDRLLAAAPLGPSAPAVTKVDIMGAGKGGNLEPLTVNRHLIDSSDAAAEVMRALRVGSTLEMRVFRAGRDRDVRYALPERPLSPGDVPGDRKLAPIVKDRLHRPSIR